MKWQSVFSYLGLVLIVLALSMLLPFVASFVFGDGVYIPFLLAAFVSFVIGLALVKKFKRENLTLGSAMVLAGSAFIAVSLLGSIVYLDHLPPLDAIFEAVSGFTTTGLTTVKPESLPYSILFWRSLTQWLGGLGMLIIVVLLLSSPGMSAYYVHKSEIKTHRVEGNVYLVVKRLFVLYVILTLAGIFLFLLAGMPAFDAVNHAFTALSTGGFSVKNSSIGYYANPLIEIVAILLMVAGATSFFVHSRFFSRKFGDYLRSSETQLFWSLVVIFSLLLSVSFLPSLEPLRTGVFYTFASLTTGGFNLGAASFPELSKFLIIILMVIGGFAGSIAGGLKLVRVGVLGKAMTWVSKKIFYPSSAVVPFKYNKRTIGDEELTIISLFSFAYILILIISSMLLSFMGHATIDAFFVSASAEGTVGLTTLDIASMNPAGKIILIFDMLLGRLEILPFFVLFFALYSRMKNR
jgi:trk system potassium uptake protein TrkH